MTRIVRDTNGRKYVIEKQSSQSTRVRDPQTGERTHLPNDELEPVEGTSSLDVALAGLPKPVVSLVSGVPNRRALGLLADIDTRGPTSVRTLIEETTFCESDLHGTLTVLCATDLLREVKVAGERGYETTDTAHAALELLRE